MIPLTVPLVSPVHLDQHSIGATSQGACNEALNALRGSMRPLDANAVPQFADWIRQFPQATSELTAVNLFAWAPMQYNQYALVDGHLVVSYDPGITGQSRKFLTPIGPDPVSVMRKLQGECDAIFVRVGMSIALRMPAGVSVIETPHDHDYLYTPAQIDKLEGSAASELRRRLHKFERQHGAHVSVCAIDPSTLQDAEQVVGKWLATRLASLTAGSDRDGKNEDAMACRRILENWGHFPGLRGVVVYSNGEPISLAIGEMVGHPGHDRRVLISHFEKSVLSRKYEGLPVFCFRQLCRDLPADTLVNRMQSAGSSGLASWKQSWGPIGFEKKAVVGSDPYLGTNIPEPQLFGRPSSDVGWLRPTL